MSHDNERYLRLPEVLKITGFSRATLYRKIKAGTFPRQYRISERCCGWRASEVAIWSHSPVTFTVADLKPKLV